MSLRDLPADGGRGAEHWHRYLSHTADLTIESHAPTLAGCLEETVMALVESFLDVSGDTASTTPVPVKTEGTDGEDLLVQLLEDVIYLAEVLGLAPVGVELADTEEGGVAGFFDMAKVGELEIVGAVPKAVSRHDLGVSEDPGGWTCRVTVDV